MRGRNILSGIFPKPLVSAQKTIMALFTVPPEKETKFDEYTELKDFFQMESSIVGDADSKSLGWNCSSEPYR